MAHDRPFELRVVPLPDGDYGIALFQRRSGRTELPRKARRRSITDDENNQPPWRQVVWVKGTPFRAVVDQVMATLKRSGYKSSDLARTRQKPFELSEEEAVRLGLLMMAVKPLCKIERMDAVSSQIRGMSDEEAYYWFSKSTRPDAARRAQKALRILLARE